MTVLSGGQTVKWTHCFLNDLQHICVISYFLLESCEGEQTVLHTFLTVTVTVIHTSACTLAHITLRDDLCLLHDTRIKPAQLVCYLEEP